MGGGGARVRLLGGGDGEGEGGPFPCARAIGHRALTVIRPFSICAASSADRIPARESALAYSMLPRISTRQKRLSKPMLLLKRSIRGSVLPVNRPPHNFAEEAAAAGAALLLPLLLAADMARQPFCAERMTR
jgi:hypothetical protein